MADGLRSACRDALSPQNNGKGPVGGCRIWPVLSTVHPAMQVRDKDQHPPRGYRQRDNAGERPFRVACGPQKICFDTTLWRSVMHGGRRSTLRVIVVLI